MTAPSHGVTSLPAGGLEVTHVKDGDGRFYPSDAIDGTGRTVVGVVLEDYQGSAIPGETFGVEGSGAYAWFGPQLSAARARVFLSALPADPADEQLQDRIDELEEQLSDAPDVGFPPTDSYTPVVLDEAGDQVPGPRRRGLSPLAKGALIAGGLLGGVLGVRWALRKMRRRRRR